MTTQHLGEEGLRWFIGTVEDFNDPKQLGRVKVRVINEHSRNDVSTEELRWAIPLLPTTSGGVAGTNQTPALKNGAVVFGFFADGNEKNMPFIWGTYAKLVGGKDTGNELSGLSRGKNTIQDNLVGPEPASSFAAKYPYNNVTQTLSGHVIELDDTKDNERIRIYHKSGTYIEINKDGQFVKKTVGDNIEVMVKDHTVYVQGNVSITSGKSIVMTAAEGITLNAPGGVTLPHGGLTAVGSLATTVGASGTFTDITGKMISVHDGIITNIAKS